MKSQSEIVERMKIAFKLARQIKGELSKEEYSAFCGDYTSEALLVIKIYDELKPEKSQPWVPTGGGLKTSQK